MTKEFCKGFCRTCGTGCGEFTREILQLRAALDEARTFAKYWEEICKSRELLWSGELDQLRSEVAAMKIVVDAAKQWESSFRENHQEPLMRRALFQALKGKGVSELGAGSSCDDRGGSGGATLNPPAHSKGGAG